VTQQTGGGGKAMISIIGALAVIFFGPYVLGEFLP
jgi:hypothetical protein